MKLRLLLLSLYVLNLVQAQDSLGYKKILWGTGVTPSLCSGDLKDRFKNFNAVSTHVLYKSKSNITLGASYGTFFSQNSTIKSDIFTGMLYDNYLIDINGNPSNIRMHLRGFQVTANLGKIWKIKENKEILSGVHTQLGVGMMQTRIKMRFDSNKVPQLEDDYLYGYDQLHNGLVLTENIQYIKTSSQNLSYFAGIQFAQGFTHNRRAWEYSLNFADTKTKKDFYVGFNIGLYIPFTLTDKKVKNYFD